MKETRSTVREVKRVQHSKGVVIVTVSAMLVVLLAFGSMAVDVGYVLVIRNQLQNAADAGALAGARFLYINSGQAVNPQANQLGYEAAIANMSQGQPVEVQGADTGFANNLGDVQRGHWTFATETFTPNDSLAPVTLWDVSSAELDANVNFINAVRVRTRREQIPANSFLARVLGFNSFQVHAEAVAYIGFAGTLEPQDVDQPIAICQQSILNEDDEYNCNTGRMIDSGGTSSHNTAGWSNFSQPCDTASAQSVRPLVCNGNLTAISFGQDMGTVGGMQDNVYRDLRDCWLVEADSDGDGVPDSPWNMTLPVIDCQANNVNPCSLVVGSVNVNVLWVKESGVDPHFNDIPLRMLEPTWECSIASGIVSPRDLASDADRMQCWQEFASTFGLHTYDDVSVGDLAASDLQKTLFFLPDCTPHEPKGTTGGLNFGILAEIPVLVD